MPHRPGLLQVQTVDVLFDELTLVHPHRLEVQSFGFITAPSAGQQGGQVVDAPGSAPAEVHVLSRGTGVVYICVCVCVNPWAKGSPPPPFHLHHLFHHDREFHTQGRAASVVHCTQRSYDHRWEGIKDA